jgi:hypothetical protein
MNDIKNMIESSHDMFTNMNDIPDVTQNKIESAGEIKEQVNEIIKFCLKKENNMMRRDNIDAYKQICMRLFTDFHQKYPTLFFSIIENPSSFPLYRLDEMLNLKKKIEENEINEEKASVHLGQKYYNEFVKNTVSELDKDIKK